MAKVNNAVRIVEFEMESDLYLHLEKLGLVTIEDTEYVSDLSCRSKNGGSHKWDAFIIGRGDTGTGHCKSLVDINATADSVHDF